MDSSKFAGGIYGQEYDTVIDMLVNIWQINQKPRPILSALQQ